MNIARENNGDLNAVLKVTIEKSDYENKVETVLKDYRKKANIKGFRPGMVPMGLITKMYGRSVKVDEINKIISESVQKYITDEKIDILGDPLPKEDDLEGIDFDAQEDFTFAFELGLAPDIELSLSKKNKVKFHNITVDKKMKNDYVENYSRRYGEIKKVDTTEEKDIIKGQIAALNKEGELIQDGISVEETSISIDIIKDNKIKTQFLNKKVNDAIDFDIKKAFPNELELAGILHKKKEEIEGIDEMFRFTINEITRFYPAEIGQELFDKIYGEGVVKSQDEFMSKIEEEITGNLKLESDYKVGLDIKTLAIDKTQFQLPEEFLKRWLLKVNENSTKEQIEAEFDKFLKDLRWQLIRNKIARDNEMKITEEELTKEAVNITRYQFQQYGLYNTTDEQLSSYAQEILKREDEAKRIADRILDNKVISFLKETVKIENKNVTLEEFNGLLKE